VISDPYRYTYKKTRFLGCAICSEAAITFVFTLEGGWSDSSHSKVKKKTKIHIAGDSEIYL